MSKSIYLKYIQTALDHESVKTPAEILKSLLCELINVGSTFPLLTNTEKELAMTLVKLLVNEGTSQATIPVILDQFKVMIASHELSKNSPLYECMYFFFTLFPNEYQSSASATPEEKIIA